MDGLEIHVHGNAQDQLGQITEARQAGRLRRRGPDLPVRRQGRRGLRPGQRRRPADDQRRGPPRVVINGTSLDFLAESFMAGDPHKAAASPSSTASTSTSGGTRSPQPGRTPAATCSRWPPAARSTSATRTTRWERSAQRRRIPAPLTEADWRLIRPTWRKTSGCSASGWSRPAHRRRRTPRPRRRVPQGPAVKTIGPQQDQGTAWE